MKLKEGTIGQNYQIREMELPLQTERRLEALGMLKKTILEVLNKKKHGAMIIKVRGTRFAIGRKIAEQITIEEVKP